MKKALNILIIFLLAVNLTGCGKGELVYEGSYSFDQGSGQGLGGVYYKIYENGDVYHNRFGETLTSKKYEKIKTLNTSEIDELKKRIAVSEDVSDYSFSLIYEERPPAGQLWFGPKVKP